MSESLSFEEAWPEIKAGKAFKFMPWDRNYWTDGTLEILGNYLLTDVAQMKFQIKREPREFVYCLQCCRMTEHPILKCMCKQSDLIKVREVLD